MIKKEIGCTTLPRHATFRFVPCRICLMVQGDMYCVHFRHEVGAKMVFEEFKEIK